MHNQIKEKDRFWPHKEELNSGLYGHLVTEKDVRAFYQKGLETFRKLLVRRCSHKGSK